MKVKITLIVCLIILIISVLLCYNYIYIPQTKIIEDKKNQFLEEIKKNEIAYKIYMTRNEIDNYLKYFPESSDISSFVSQISNNVKDARIELLSMTPLKVKKFDEYHYIPVKLNLVDSYHNFGEFVSLLEKSEYFIKIKSFSIETNLSSQSGDSDIEKTNKEGEVVTDIELEVNTFYIP